MIKYLLLGLLFFISSFSYSAINATSFKLIEQQVNQNKNLTGVLLLDRAEDALLTRAWLADNALFSIDVQYFIWSSDNIGTLASEALLRAAERGVKVRVIVDDLLIDAPDKILLALAKHPNVNIRIYNPKYSVGTPLTSKVLNFLTDFRGVNQRMHNKVFVVDDKIAITGGRNMAEEYFGYSHKYNYRDRDIFVVGEILQPIIKNFNQYWKSPLSINVEDRFNGLGLFKKNIILTDTEIKDIYKELHKYAQLKDNFSPAVRNKIADIASRLHNLLTDIIWVKAEFIGDKPGKNNNSFFLDGGGITGDELALLIAQAKHKIVIQSPYLILSSNVEELFTKALKRGVKISISTNSLASSDNIQAYSGYFWQRKKLLRMGISIFEYKPNPKNWLTDKAKTSVVSLHAKTMVIDTKIVAIGTYNLDPRSENLNTEIVVIINDNKFAKKIEMLIKTDMETANSWEVALDNPDYNATLWKQFKLLFWQFIPMKPIL